MPSFESISVFLEAHAALAYATLFLGSYFETLIGVGFFIYGEIFFLPGAILAGAGVLNIWIVTAALLLGGIFGDTTSYVIGRRYGMHAFRENAWVFNLNNYARGKQFFDAHGPKAVFLARFLGPISWVTPFLAGVYKLPYRTFLPYNVLGVIGGIGQFILIGYFFGATYTHILALMQDYGPYFLGGLVLAGTLYYYLRRK